jgi:hypothetical protein
MGPASPGEAAQELRLPYYWYQSASGRSITALRQGRPQRSCVVAELGGWGTAYINPTASDWTFRCHQPNNRRVTPLRVQARVEPPASATSVISPYPLGWF